MSPALFNSKIFAGFGQPALADFSEPLGGIAALRAAIIRDFPESEF